MAFDINRYKDDVFHEDEETNNRIKVLLLWFEYQNHTYNYRVNEQIGLIDNILGVCVKQEWYEVATFFKGKKNKLLLK